MALRWILLAAITLGCSAVHGSVVVFNEIMYHPPGNPTPASEWIELQNQHAVAVDVSGWTLSGGVTFTFPAATVLPPEGYLIIASNPSLVQAPPGVVVLGPFQGRLANSGDHLELRDLNHRILDSLSYGVSEPWTSAADGGGVSLARRGIHLATDTPDSWTHSRQQGGTPGRENFPAFRGTVTHTPLLSSSPWRYLPDGATAPADWNTVGFSEQGWRTGTGPFTETGSVLATASGTLILPSQVTHYFRTEFEYDGVPLHSSLVLRSRIDDGAVIYLNGAEVARANMPTGIVTAATGAASGILHASLSTLALPQGLIRKGSNTIAIEIHQGPVIPPYPRSVADSLPVGYWRMGDSSPNIVDTSAQAGFQSGTATGISTSNLRQLGPRPLDLVLGKNLRGFETGNASTRFNGNLDDGNDVIEIPVVPALDFGGAKAFTLELWVHGPTVQEEGAGLVSRGVGGGGEQFALDVFAGKYRFFTRSASDPNQVAQVNATIGPVNSWQHLAATHDPVTGFMSLYINGTLAGTAPALPTLLSSPSPIAIGSRLGIDGTYNLNFNGRIDELAIYNRALSADELALHFNATLETFVPAELDAQDVTFQLEADVVEQIPEPTAPQIRFNETVLIEGEPIRAELLNHGTEALDLSGWTLEAVHDNDTLSSARLPSARVPSGGYLLLELTALSLQAKAGDRLVLWSTNHSQLVDATVLTSGRRALGVSPDGSTGWRTVRVSTLGTPNQIEPGPAVILSELMYHPRGFPAEPDVFGEPTEVISLTQSWWFRGDGVDLTSSWATRTVDPSDAAWALSRAPFVWPSNLVFSGPKNTLLPLTNSAKGRVITHYFQTPFTHPGSTQDLFLRLTPLLDDGAVIYLNGTEVARINLTPGSPVTYSTLASSSVGNPGVAQPLLVPASALVPNQNWIAVELHQSSTNSNQDAAFALQVEIVPRLKAALPFRESANAWIEIQNVSPSPVSLDGWKIDGGIKFAFPSNQVLAPGTFLLVAKDPSLLQPQVPSTPVLGPFSGKLSHRSDHVILRDALNNPVHAVQYWGGGRWPDLADGVGSSLELRDPHADPAIPESWAASDESTKLNTWQTYRWRGLGTPGQTGEPDVWKELALALLDGPGEVLIDDVSVVENPSTTPRELIVNGRFESPSLARWRFQGTHRHSELIEDPTDASNHVLLLRANGAGEYQGNQVETTLTNNLAISATREYEISYRALWRSGGRKLNARLYFNRLARTMDLPVPLLGGTPGASNSVAIPNLGPGFARVRHVPPVPAPTQPILIEADLTDTDGIREAWVHFQVNTSGWQRLPLNPNGTQWSTEIPGQKAASLIQFYLECIDLLGATAFFPAAGPDSRALIRIQDGQASPGYTHHLRILMSDADARFLHTPTNTLSNELLPCTVIDNENDIYYDVGVRLKGSFVGRNVPRVGFHLGFHEDQPFRGRHRTVSVDRSQHASTGGLGELVSKHIANAAGGIPASYDDVVYLVAPVASYNIVAQLRTSALDAEYLDGWWDQGSDGSVFEVEVHRWNLTTVDGKPEGIKVVGNESGGTGYTDLEMLDWGNNPEVYRWNHLLTNHREVDDYSGPVRLCQLFGLPQSSVAQSAVDVLDVDQWLRVMAYQILVGPADAVYTGGAVHNFRYYVRPGDQRILYVPWDWDSTWLKGPNDPLFGNGNIAKLVATPDTRRRYLNHVYDLVDSTFNKAYMANWVTHYGDVGKQDLRSILDYIDARAKYVLTQLPLSTPFAVTNQSDVTLTDPEGRYIIGGKAPIQVQEVVINGISYPIQWLNNTNWQVQIYLTPGLQKLNIQGYTLRGSALTNAIASLTVTATGGQPVLPVVINEWMADNAGPGGLADPADGLFQDWFELYNPNRFPVPLGGYYLTDNLNQPTKWRVPDGVTLKPLEYLVVWADNNPDQTTTLVPASQSVRLHTSFALANGGESIGLFAPDGVTPVSTVVFGGQLSNVSQGAFPDGTTGSGTVYFQLRPTPGAPNSAEPLPRILYVQHEPAGAGQGSLVITFASQPGQVYQIQYLDTLGGAGWSVVGNGIGLQATSVQTTATLPMPGGARFFRIAQ